jgi:hypothetical protein
METREWLTEPNVGRVAHELSEGMDGDLNEQVDGKEAVTKRYFAEWEMLRMLWFNRELTKASSELRVRAMLNSLSCLSCCYGSVSWNEASEKDKELFDLWQRISTKPFEKAQHLFPELLERIGTNQREQTVASWIPEPAIPRVATGIKDRVNRLKGLGNSIVPQVAFQILKAIYDVETMQKVRN